MDRYYGEYPSQGNYKEPNKERHGLLRRATVLLGLLSALGGGAKVAGPTVVESIRDFVLPNTAVLAGENPGGGTKDQGPNNVLTPALTLTPSPTLTPEPTLTSVPPPTAEFFSRQNIEGAVFVFDSQHQPVSYTLPSGESIEFDPTEIRRVRERAKQSQETEVLDTIRFQTKEANNPNIPTINNRSSTEHPVLKTLPKNTLTEVELKQRNIEVIQADNTQLYIRSQAFEEGGPLQYFQGKIILVPGPVVSPGYLKDDKYNEVRGLLEDLPEIEKYRTQIIKKTEEYLDNLRSGLLKAKKENNFKDMALYEDLLGEFKADILSYQKATTEELLIEINQASRAGGKYVEADSPVIFIAVGVPTNTTEVRLFFDKNGNCHVSYGGILPSPGLQPKENQSCPDPTDFRRNPAASSESGSYSYGAQTSGQALRHEIMHYRLMTENYFRRLKLKHEILATAPDNNEYTTDEAAMEGIRDAWKKWVESGYTDDSGYCFVFSLPEGGFILTSHLGSLRESAPKINL